MTDTLRDYLERIIDENHAAQAWVSNKYLNSQDWPAGFLHQLSRLDHVCIEADDYLYDLDDKTTTSPIVDFVRTGWNMFRSRKNNKGE